MIGRNDFREKILAELRNQDYGSKAQPTRPAMSWAITNAVWGDVESMRNKLMIIASLVDDPNINPGDVVAAIAKITDSGDQS